MIRKILMVSIAVFFNYDIQIQSLLATLLCVSVLCVHALGCPYVTDAMDGLELLSLFGSFCTYFFGQFLFTPSVGPAGRTIVSFIIVIVNLIVMGAIFAMVIGQGVGIVGKFGAKLRRICCCGKNKQPVAQPQKQIVMDGTLGIQQQPVVQNAVGYAPNQPEQKENAEFSYNTSGRGKRKKKARDDADYGNIDYANVDHSQSESSPHKPNKDIRLQSNLLGNDNFAVDDNEVAMENKIAVVEENNQQFAMDDYQQNMDNQYEYTGNDEDDEPII